MTKRTIDGVAGLAGLLLAAALPAVAAAQTQSPVSPDDRGGVSEPADPQRSRDDEVENVVVTGARRRATELAVEAIEYGNQVQIVTAEEIEAGGYTNFAEAVQQLVRGANIGYSPDEGEYTIRLDGGGDRDTLVVLDGVPLYDRGPALEDIWGSTTIDPHMVERIEVFRGGQSLYFGGNGGIGVVSIVTKRPDGTRKGEFGVNYGSFNTRELWANYAFPLDPQGRHSVMFYGSSHQTDGPRIFRPEDYVDNVALAGGVQDFPLNRNNVGAKYLWNIDDTASLRLNAQYTQIEFFDAFPSNTVYSPNRVTFPILDAAFEKTWSEAFATEVTAYYSNPRLRNTELYPEICEIPAGCVDPNNPTRIIPFGDFTGAVEPYPNQGFGRGNQFTGGFKEYGARIHNRLAFGEALELAAGVQVVRYQDDSDPVFPVGDEVATVTGVYVDARPTLPFSPETKLSLAVRTDFAEAFDSKTIWKFGFRHPLPAGFYVRGNGGTSYSLPRTNELFARTETFVGNPNLQPEETETYNFGVGLDRAFGGGRLRAEVSAFSTDITGRIRSTSGLTPNTRFNDPAVTEIRGFTADLDTFITPEWSLVLSYTNQKATPAGSDLQIGETPEWFAQGRLTYRSASDRFHFSLLPRYQGPEFATGGPGNIFRTNFGEYLVVNATFGYWLGEERQHRFQLRVVNLFDEEYAERFGYGNKLFSREFNRGEIQRNSPEFFFPYPFEGKPRGFYVSYSTDF